MEEFADILRELREKAGLTQEGLARKANLSLGYVAKLEGRRAQPSWATVKALAKALGVSCSAFERNDLLAGQGQEPKKDQPAKKSRKSD
jgi:transcriptional regulator with XRE-family HTH domain